MPAPADLPGSLCTGRPTTMDFTNSAFTVKFFAYYFEKLSGLVELMDASFNKHEATTANGKQLRNQLRFRHRQLSLSVNAVSKEVHDMPKTAKLTPTQQYDFGAILVDSIKHYSWIVTLVCEGCCPIDRRIWAGPPSMSLFITSFPLMTENNKHHLKQLSQFRHSHVHAANTYADHQGELCHSQKLPATSNAAPAKCTSRFYKDANFSMKRSTGIALVAPSFLASRLILPPPLR